jgi:hypothetical protein
MTKRYPRAVLDDPFLRIVGELNRRLLHQIEIEKPDEIFGRLFAGWLSHVDHVRLRFEFRDGRSYCERPVLFTAFEIVWNIYLRRASAFFATLVSAFVALPLRSGAAASCADHPVVMRGLR